MIKTVNASPFTASLKGLALSALVTVGLLVISAIPLTESKDLEILSQILPKCIQALASLIGGAVTGRLLKEKAHIFGMLTGAMYGVILVIGMILLGGFDIVKAVISLGIPTVMGLLGSFIGTPKEKSPSSKRRALMKKIGK